MPDDEKVHRTRLEGRAELLEATLLRYRALANALRSLRWKQAVQRNAALLQETAGRQAEVDEALEAVEHRARREGWSRRSTVVRCADEVRALRDELQVRSGRRLGRSAPPTLSERLVALERAVLEAPRVVLPGQRWATAVAVLPATLPEVRGLQSLTAVFAPVFKRPAPLGRLLPYEAGELEALEEALARAHPHLERAWARVRQVDAAGTVTRHLQRRARRMPTHPPANGAERLLEAQFWLDLGLARLEEQVAQRVSPLTLREGELLPVARWLWAAERGRARLAAAGPLSEGRAGLFELAYALLTLAPGRAAGAGVWAALEDCAERADLAPPDEDFARLRDNLRLFFKVVAKEKTSARAGGEAGSLRELVVALRRLAAR